MIQDPFFTNELKRYDNPIASRKFILEILAKQDTPISKSNLYKLLEIQGKRDRLALSKRLFAMEQAGQILITKKGIQKPKATLNELDKEVKKVVKKFAISDKFSSAIEKQLNNIPKEITNKTLETRVDLRHIDFVTIDGETAKDFDDAVYAKKNANGWNLLVAIADVSFYVKHKSPLDKEALKRGNSVYFANSVIPMLPEILSNELCSLKPKVDRLCLVADLQISKTGELTGYKFYEAVIHSKARLTYTKVWQLLSQGIETTSIKEVKNSIFTLYEMFKILQKSRFERHALDFETPELNFAFDSLGNVEKVIPIIRNDAHKLIEECMILANIACAKFIEKSTLEGIFRIHEKPKSEKFIAFKNFIKGLGIHWQTPNTPSNKAYCDLIDLVNDRADREIIHMMMLRSLTQAQYSPENVGHFGLSLTQYAHFTSPIRRYSDLIVHRIIKKLINAPTGISYSLNELQEISDQCCNTEKTAFEATREIDDWLKCIFMQKYIGDEFKATVVSVTNFGLFVRIKEFGIDGLVHISKIDFDYYQFDQDKQRLVGRSGKIYKIGDELIVKLVSVNSFDRKIDFIQVSNKPRSRKK